MRIMKFWINSIHHGKECHKYDETLQIKKMNFISFFGEIEHLTKFRWLVTPVCYRAELLTNSFTIFLILYQQFIFWCSASNRIMIHSKLLIDSHGNPGNFLLQLFLWVNWVAASNCTQTPHDSKNGTRNQHKVAINKENVYMHEF